MSDGVKYTAIVLISLIAGFGGNVALTEDQFVDAYVCSTNEKVYLCSGNIEHPDALSSTSKSCYYTQDGLPKRSVCTNGQFIHLFEYAAMHNVSKEEILYGGINAPKDLNISNSLIRISNSDWICPTENGALQLESFCTLGNTQLEFRNVIISDNVWEKINAK